MLSRQRIRDLFVRINQGLKARGEKGEIGIVGGAVMCLVLNARDATKDVDAVFAPAKILRQIAAEIAEEEGLPADWLNDAAKGYVVPGFRREEVLALSHLTVWAPEPRYMLAMKCISARWDSSDRDDVIFLVKLLEISDPAEVFRVIEGYYPKNQIPSKTKFFIEEILEPEKS